MPFVANRAYYLHILTSRTKKSDWWLSPRRDEKRFPPRRRLPPCTYIYLVAKGMSARGETRSGQVNNMWIIEKFADTLLISHPLPCHNRSRRATKPHMALIGQRKILWPISSYYTQYIDTHDELLLLGQQDEALSNESNEHRSNHIFIYHQFTILLRYNTRTIYPHGEKITPHSTQWRHNSPVLSLSSHRNKPLVLWIALIHVTRQTDNK